jgi:hypothetical protein
LRQWILSRHPFGERRLGNEADEASELASVQEKGDRRHAADLQALGKLGLLVNVDLDEPDPRFES